MAQSRDIAKSQIDFRFREKNGHAADVTATTDFGPDADIGRTEIPQRSSLLPTLGALSFRWTRRRPHPIQNISGLPQRRDQPFGGTLIVR